MARVQLMFPQRDVTSALKVRDTFNEVGMALRGEAGDKCLIAAQAIAGALVALELMESPKADQAESGNGEQQ